MLGNGTGHYLIVPYVIKRGKLSLHLQIRISFLATTDKFLYWDSMGFFSIANLLVFVTVHSKQSPSCCKHDVWPLLRDMTWQLAVLKLCILISLLHQLTQSISLPYLSQSFFTSPPVLQSSGHVLRESAIISPTSPVLLQFLLVQFLLHGLAPVCG